MELNRMERPTFFGQNGRLVATVTRATSRIENSQLAVVARRGEYVGVRRLQTDAVHGLLVQVIIHRFAPVNESIKKIEFQLSVSEYQQYPLRHCVMDDHLEVISP